MFSALVKLLVRELRTTERTNVIVLYLGGVSTLGAATACAALPGGFVVTTKGPQLGYLLGAGKDLRDNLHVSGTCCDREGRQQLAFLISSGRHVHPRTHFDLDTISCSRLL